MPGVWFFPADQPLQHSFDGAAIDKNTHKLFMCMDWGKERRFCVIYTGSTPVGQLALHLIATHIAWRRNDLATVLIVEMKLVASSEYLPIGQKDMTAAKNVVIRLINLPGCSLSIGLYGGSTLKR